MKVLLIKSGRDKLFLRAYHYLKQQFDIVHLLAKKDTLSQLDLLDIRFEYDCPKLSKKLLESKLKHLKNNKYEKIFFIMQNDNFFIKYKNIYSFIRCLDSKKTACLNMALFEQPIKSLAHFYYLSFSKFIFREWFRIIFLAVYVISKIVRFFSPKLIIERPVR